jgi:hypothetical protein
MQLSPAAVFRSMSQQVRLYRIASLTRRTMNHAVLCVTPTVRRIATDNPLSVPLAIIHTAGNHFSNPIPESPKTVPVFNENFRCG